MSAEPTRRPLAAVVVAAAALAASVVACSATRPVDSRGPSDHAPDLIAFAAAALGVPRPMKPPLVVRLDPAAMRQLACDTGSLDPRLAERGFGVGGLYARGRGVVAVSRRWRADDPADVGCLLHELTHYVQDAAGIVYPCPAAAEADAYGVQRRFLEAAGLSFERATGLTAADVADLARCEPGAASVPGADAPWRRGPSWATLCGPPSGIHPSERGGLGPVAPSCTSTIDWE